jgi:site-specific DNA-methyltransferase (adenine-specific)
MIKLYRGDCLSALKRIDAAAVAAVITDPPYGIGLRDHDFEFSRRRKPPNIVGDHNQDIGNAVLEWCHERNLPTAFFASPYRPWPGKWRNVLVWDKGPATGRGGDPRTCWKRTFDLIQVNRNGPLRAGRKEAVLRHYMRPDLWTNHPAEKPVGLLVDLIEQMTDRGDTVLDPFMGSGSTALACLKTGRHFIGIEIDRDHFGTAKRRISAARPRPVCVP